jgi:hypothetical protein
MPLDEPAGSNIFMDIIGNNNGSCSGDSCPLAGVDGRFGTALSFDGNNDYILIGNPVPPTLQIQNEISLEAWIYVTSYPNDQTLGLIVGCQNDTSYSGYAIHLDGRTDPDGQPAPSGHIHFQIGNGDWHATNTNSQVPLNQWVHIVAVRRANEDAQVYFNTILQPSTSAPWNGSITYDGAELDLGRQSDYYGRNFHGIIDEVAIYDRALSSQEVEMLYTNGHPGNQIPWLSVDPVSGSIPTNDSTPIQVTFDSTDLQPSVYSNTLFISSNDPVQPLLFVPVTITVTAQIPPESATITGPEAGLVGENQEFTAWVEPISTTLPLTYVWEADGQVPITHTNGLTDTVNFIWDLPGTQLITVTVNNQASEVSATHIITITAPIYETYLPLVIKTVGTPLGSVPASSYPESGMLLGLVNVGIIGRWKRRV